MGLINNDSYVCGNGVTKTGVYMSFSNETLYLRQSGSGNYSVSANYRIFWDKDARDSDKGFMELKNVSTNVSSVDLTGNLYSILYAKLKEQYPNSVEA
jgi:hypothetical protein